MVERCYNVQDDNKKKHKYKKKHKRCTIRKIFKKQLAVEFTHWCWLPSRARWRRKKLSESYRTAGSVVKGNAYRGPHTRPLW